VWRPGKDSKLRGGKRNANKGREREEENGKEKGGGRKEERRKPIVSLFAYLYVSVHLAAL